MTFTRHLLSVAPIVALMYLAGCTPEPSVRTRPQLLSVEAARVENASALHRMGIELGGPMPARFDDFESCAAHEVACSLPQKNADRID